MTTPEPARPAVTAVVMAYNEAETLDSVVKGLDDSLKSLGRPYELLIVDDGSTDGTGPSADRLSVTMPGVRVVHHPANQGLGGVYRTGFSAAAGEAVTFFPADGQYAPEILPRFAACIADADLVLGRMEARTDSRLGRFLSGAERALFRMLFGPLPEFQGILMVRRPLFAEIPLRSRGRGWAIVLELLIRAHRGGYRLRSEPISVRPRTHGRSKVQNLGTLWANLIQAVALRRVLAKDGVLR